MHDFFPVGIITIYHHLSNVQEHRKTSSSQLVFVKWFGVQYSHLSRRSLISCQGPPQADCLGRDVQGLWQMNTSHMGVEVEETCLAPAHQQLFPRERCDGTACAYLTRSSCFSLKQGGCVFTQGGDIILVPLPTSAQLSFICSAHCDGSSVL